MLASCVHIPAEQAAREAVMWEAARECKARYSTIQSVDRIDHYGRIHFTYLMSGPQNQDFIECYGKLTAEKLKGRPVIAPGVVAAGPSGLATTVVPLELRGATMIVPAVVNELRSAALLLDTGADVTVFNPDFLRRLNVTVPITAPRWPITVVGGDTIQMPFVRVSALRVGDFVVEDIDVGVYEAVPKLDDVDGILGGNFLGHFTVTIDRQKKQLSLRR